MAEHRLEPAVASLDALGCERLQLPSTYPELRIERAVHFGVDYLTDEWNRFLNTVGSINRNTGYTMALGSMAVSYVNAEEMNRMLADKYPKIISDRHKIRGIVTRLNKSYEQFVRSERHEKDEMDDWALVCDVPEVDRTTIDARCWEVADVMLGDFFLDNYDSAKRICFRVEDEPFMHEFDRTRVFLASENFPVHLIERKTPHVSFFRAVRPIGSSLKLPAEWPAVMRFHPPKGVL